MMIATERATFGRSISEAALKPRSRLSLVSGFTVFSSEGAKLVPRLLNFQDLGFLAFQELVDLVDVLVGELLCALLGAALLVVAGLALPNELLEVLHQVTADVPNRHAA